MTQDGPNQTVGEPLYFSSGGQDLFAWLHRPAVAGPTGVGLVICKPFGYEALCAHRSVRAFAESAAEQGIPALRFDYLGCGDSADIDPAADQVAVWVENVLAAVTELRGRTGVKRVCLVGIRLGALLAALAASRSSEIQGLVLVAPVVAGKRYLRELRTGRLAALMGTETEAGAHTADDSENLSPGSMEFSGYSMSFSTMDSLSKIDLTKLAAPPVSQVLIIDRDDLPVASSWSDDLAQAGVATAYVALKGFVEMALVAPQFAVLPTAISKEISKWLKLFAEGPDASGRPLVAAPVELNAPGAMLRLSANETSDSELTEIPIAFGTDISLFGILTHPGKREVRRRGVILLNAGADYHMGASRMYVSLARRWARRGYYVLRMDLAGLGDSDTREKMVENDMFPPDALKDVEQAVKYVREHFGIREVTLAGLCSGAYHALRAAAAGLPIDRILMVNPQNYFWTQGTAIDDLQLAEVVRNPGVYKSRIQSANAWKRLLTGRVDVWKIFKIYAYRQVLMLESPLRNLCRSMHIRLPNDLGWDLEQIVKRGVYVTFLFARGEPGIGLLTLQGGSSVKKLGDHCRVRIIEDADHTFSRSGPRLAMERLLSDELFSWRKDSTLSSQRARDPESSGTSPTTSGGKGSLNHDSSGSGLRRL